MSVTSFTPHSVKLPAKGSEVPDQTKAAMFPAVERDAAALAQAGGTRDMRLFSHLQQQSQMCKAQPNLSSINKIGFLSHLNIRVFDTVN